MTTEDAGRLEPGVTRIRHCNGSEGTYLGCFITNGLQLIVDDGTGRRTWAASDCEVTR